MVLQPPTQGMSLQTHNATAGSHQGVRGHQRHPKGHLRAKLRVRTQGRDSAASAVFSLVGLRANGHFQHRVMM